MHFLLKNDQAILGKEKFLRAQMIFNERLMVKLFNCLFVQGTSSCLLEHCRQYEVV